MANRYRPPAIRRAVQLLNHLADADTPLRLSDLAKVIGCNKSSVLGIMGALETAHWVKRSGQREGYVLGRGLLLLARKALGFWELSEIARPFMERVAERIGESVFVGTRQSNRVVILGCAEGRNELRVTSPPGTALPLLAAATGKVFLAGVDQEEARKTLCEIALPRFTECSIQDVEVFLSELEQVRTNGYATDDEEYLRGVRAVAAPIRSMGGTVGAMWVVGFVSSMTDDLMHKAARELLDATSIISDLIETRISS